MPSLPPPPVSQPASSPEPGELPPPQDERLAADEQLAVDEPPWRIWTAPAAVVFGLAIGVFATIVVELVGQAGGSSLSHPTPAVSILADIVFDLGFVAAALSFASLHGRPRLSDF